MSNALVIDPGDVLVTDAPAPFVPRKRTIQLGTAFMTAATVMYFGGLFGVYVSSRGTHITGQNFLEGQAELAGETFSRTPWIPSGATVELTAPTMITWTLIMSMVTMQWAVWCFKRHDRRHGLIALATTAMFGVAVINQVVFQWKQLGLVIDDVAGTAASTLIYTITASHVAMIALAIGMLAFAAFKALASNDTADHVDSVASAATYWYAMVSIYFVIWILIFITK